MPETPLILSVFPAFAVGGQQARFAALANHFAAGWRHAIVSLNGDLACCERLAPEVVADFPTLDLRTHLPGRLARIRQMIAALKPDVLVTHNWGAIEWAMANALRPLVHHVHIEDGFGPEERNQQIARRVWTRRLTLRASTTILPSQTLLALARNVWKLPKQRLHYVANGIDLTRFAPLSTAQPRETLVIGTIAALREEKNLARLLHAFALVRARMPARLDIVGDGPQAPALRALSAELGLQDWVRFLGHQSNPAQFLADFDIFALSSDTEQMPLSVLEAMATGLAVVATSVGDVALMVSAANQPYIVPRDAAALADAVCQLGADRALRQRIGADNRAEMAARFDQAQMFQAYQTLLLSPSAG